MPITAKYVSKMGTFNQHTFNPIDYGFRWTEDGWYSWDSKISHDHAKLERDEQARQFKAKGRTVRKFTVSKQLISRGGIGSGKPHVEFVVTIYGINVS